MATLNEMLQAAGKTVEDIEEIYCGKDHWCRCGCGGNYHEPGSRGFKMAITRMNKPDFSCFNVEDMTGKNAYHGTEWMNIPYDDSDDAGKCYCVYFKKGESN